VRCVIRLGAHPAPQASSNMTNEAGENRHALDDETENSCAGHSRAQGAAKRKLATGSSDLATMRRWRLHG